MYIRVLPMVAKVKSPTSRKKVSYELLERFSELLICGRCFRKHVRKPVRQLMSSHHRPVALCHDCSNEVLADRNARILRMN